MTLSVAFIHPMFGHRRYFFGKRFPSRFVAWSRIRLLPSFTVTLQLLQFGLRQRISQPEGDGVSDAFLSPVRQVTMVDAHCFCSSNPMNPGGVGRLKVSFILGVGWTVMSVVSVLILDVRRTGMSNLLFGCREAKTLASHSIAARTWNLDEITNLLHRIHSNWWLVIRILVTLS